MAKRSILAFLGAAVLVSAFAAVASDQPKSVSASAAPALSADHAAKLQRLQRLGAPDPKLELAAAQIHTPIKPMKVKKEISCGIWVYPPNPSPMATSPRLYFVNSTNGPLPPGTRIQWEVDGVPATCCNGTTNPISGLPPNPPTPAFLYTMQPLVVPPQPWTRPCKAWAIIP